MIKRIRSWFRLLRTKCRKCKTRVEPGVRLCTPCFDELTEGWDDVKPHREVLGEKPAWLDDDLLT